MNYDALTKGIVEWLRTYAIKAKVDGFVVGVSGGIDSAVVSKLCSMTGLRTVCVTMSIAQNKLELERASKHIDQLVNISEESELHNIDVVNFDFTSVYEHFMLTLNDPDSYGTWRQKKTDFDDLKYDDLREPVFADTEFLSRANTRARLRMTTLYYIATKHKLLVAGTGNKIEDFGVGFFTKYGDGGVDLSPIADLYKTEVYALGAHLNIINEILVAKPTDGLWDDGRTDEDQIGATYAELESAMKFIDKNPTYSPEDLENMSEREQEVLRIYKDRHNKNRHKMVPIPVFETKSIRNIA